MAKRNMILLILTAFVNVQAYVLCKESIVKDGKGFSWLNYCDELGEKVKFFKEYATKWTFVTDYEAGESRFAFRVPYRALKCGENTVDVDSKGFVWPAWCLETGEKLEFQMKEGEFVIDKEIGEELFQLRKPVFRKPPVFQSFLQLKNEIECVELEGDTAGRYFPVEFAENGEKIEFEKDRNGNFILDPVAKTRITTFVGGIRERNTALPLCASENLFEKDPFGPHYWIIVFKNAFPIVFVESEETFYYVNPKTGFREIRN